MDCSTIGKSPIPGSDSPAGIDIRSDDNFVALQDELQKMSDPSATSGPDIQKILDLSEQILTEKSKDLTVMCYFVFAKMKLEGISGVVEGLGCLIDMIIDYWPTLYPELKRIRGRRNSLAWLNDQLTDFFKADDAQVQPEQPADLVKKLIDEIRTLDATISKLDQDSPSFTGLVQIVSAIPIKDDAQADSAAPLSSDNQPSNSAVTPSKVASTPLSESKIQSIDDAYSALSEASKRLSDIVVFLTENQPTAPLLYRLSRIIAWGSVDDLPPLTNNRSMLPPPQDRAKNILDTLQKNSNWRDLVSFTEGQLNIDCFWLDLNRISYQALENLGEDFAAAKREVGLQTRLFIERLPAIIDYQFSDGTPYADNLSKQWIKSLGPQTSSDAGSAGNQRPVSKSLQSVLDKANKFVTQGKFVDAINEIQLQIKNLPNTRDEFVARVNICRIAINANQDATAFADLILNLITIHDLANWDPELSAEALESVYQAYTTNAANQEKASKALALLAQVDAGKAFSLGNH